MIKYLKYYFEPDSKMVRALAYESHKKYFKGTFCPDIMDMVRYQRAYVSNFRHAYATNKINLDKEAL